MVMSFCGALRGEEVPLVSLAGLLTFWEETLGEEEPFIMLTLHGKFKGEGELRWHCIPIVAITRTQLPVVKWVRRLVRRIVMEEDRRDGWLFADPRGQRRKMGYYKPTLLDLLENVQNNFPKAILAATTVNDFSLWRSGQRGAITEAHNQGVPQTVIDLMGRWRTREAARGTEPGLPMRQVYTQVKSARAALLSFSRPF